MKKFLVILCLISLSPSFWSEANASQDKNVNDECLALNYHRISHESWYHTLLTIFSNSKELNIYSVTDKTFEQQMRWLKNQHAKFITLPQLLKAKETQQFPERCVWINFDDMDQSITHYAEPILKRYNIPATGFIITGQIGNSDFHNLNLMTTQELKQLKQTKRWTFASHTHDLHAIQNKKSILLNTESTQIKQDTIKSIDRLKREFYINNNALAYPYGHTNDKVVSTLKDTPIRYGFTLDEKPITSNSNNYYIPRILISDTSFEKVVKKWKGFK